MCESVSTNMSPYCSAHDEWRIMKLCMYVVCICGLVMEQYIINYLLKLTMAVGTIVFRIIKGALIF